MTTQTTTAAPAAPQPERKPTFVGRVVRDDGVTVDRWERPVPRSVPVHYRQEREVVYDLDAADEIEEVRPQRRRRNSDVDAVTQLRIDNEQAGREFQRNTVNIAKRLGIWQWVVLVFGLGSIGWGAWVTIRGGASEYPQTQPSRNSANGGGSKSERDSVSRDSRPGRGTNHCREVLVEWLRTGQIGSMTDEEKEVAIRAVEADR